MKTYFAWISFVVLILGSLFFTCNATAMVRIMPLGDSNTRGIYGETYRDSLRQALINDAAIEVNYVGSGTEIGGPHGPGTGYSLPYSQELIQLLDNDLEHEGWGGYQISDVLANIETWLSDSPPDYILLMIGTNDLSSGGYENEHEQLSILLDRILTNAPGVKLIVASIPPLGTGFESQNEVVREYNSHIPIVVNNLAQQGHSVFFVDIYSQLDPAVDYSDALHMNSDGYAKIAAAFYDVIVQVYSGNSPPNIEILSPENWSEYEADTDILISVDTFDFDGLIDSVEFYVDDIYIGESQIPPFDFLWEVVPSGEYIITAKAFDNLNFWNYSLPVSISVGDPSRRILFVVGNSDLNSGDQAVYDRLESLNYTIILRDDDSVTQFDAEGKSLVLISSSISSNKIASTFRDIQIPVIVCEGFVFDDMYFSGPEAWADYGFLRGESQVTIVNDSHPITAGLTGTITVVDDAEGFFLWGRPTGDTIRLAEHTADPSMDAIFIFDQGDVMHEGFIAPHRRVGLFMGDYTASHFTPEGWQIFEATIQWAVNGSGPLVNLPPNVDAGDDQILISTLPTVVSINGSITDDGLPEGAVLNPSWSSDGIGVVFSNPTDLSTQVTFSNYGTFTLVLSVDDTEFIAEDELVISIIDPEEQPPVDLVYNQNPVIYYYGEIIQPNSPSSSGGPVDLYSVDPVLPIGLIFDPATGVITGTPYENVQASVHTITASNVYGDTSVDLVITVEEIFQNLLFVVGNLALNTGDQAVKERLESLNFTVISKDDDDIVVSDALGMDLILISSTVSSSKVASTFRDIQLPVIVCEGFVFDDMDFTEPEAWTDYGFLSRESQVTIVNDSHPITAGLTGTITVVDDAEGFFLWGRPTGDTIRLAEHTADPSKDAIFIFDQGDVMHEGFIAPHRRAGLFMGDYTAAHFTAEGWQIFEATVQWAVNGSGSSINQPPNVDSGGDQIIVSTLLPAFAFINGTVTDDGLPEGVVLNPSWSSDDMSVNVSNPTDLSTQVTFSNYGTFTLVLTADDTEFIAEDELVISIINPEEQPPINLVYNQNPVIYLNGEIIQSNLPSSSGGSVDIYSIDPVLPGGLIFDPATGVITGKPYENVQASVHTITASNIYGDASVDLIITVEEESQNLLFVVGSLNLNTGDQAVKERLESLNFTVTSKDDDDIVVTDALGMDLILISSTVSSSKVASTFRDIQLPTIVCEGYIFDDMVFAGPEGGTDYGFLKGESQINIVNDSHPIAAGLTGTITVVDDGEGFVLWGRPTGDTLRVAELTADPSKDAIFTFDQGDVMYDGFIAPHRRVGFFMGDYTAAHFTLEGWQIFEATVQWAVNTD